MFVGDRRNEIKDPGTFPRIRNRKKRKGDRETQLLSGKEEVVSETNRENIHILVM
jgi:hypothetical protein